MCISYVRKYLNIYFIYFRKKKLFFRLCHRFDRNNLAVCYVVGNTIQHGERVGSSSQWMRQKFIFFYFLFKLYFNLLDRSFVLITIQFDIINFFLIYSNTILKNSMHIALTKSIFKKRSILWCYSIRIPVTCLRVSVKYY